MQFPPARKNSQTISSQISSRRRGQSLIGILVSVFLLIGIAVFFLMPRGGGDGKPGKTVLKKSMERAQDVGTTSYVSQIQQGIDQIKSDNDGKAPASLEELKHDLRSYPPEMWINPIDKKPLLYNAVTGTICEDKGTGCPPGSAASAAPVAAPVAPGANPPAPGAEASAPAAPNPISPSGPGGIRMRIPQPGAGAADAMKDN